MFTLTECKHTTMETPKTYNRRQIHGMKSEKHLKKITSTKHNGTRPTEGGSPTTKTERQETRETKVPGSGVPDRF